MDKVHEIDDSKSYKMQHQVTLQLGKATVANSCELGNKSSV